MFGLMLLNVNDIFRYMFWLVYLFRNVVKMGNIIKKNERIKKNVFYSWINIILKSVIFMNWVI